MGFIVTKPFNTHIQRFGAGAPVSPTDNLSPFEFESLRTRRWIAEESTKAAEKALADDSESAPEAASPTEQPGRGRRAS